MEMKKCPFCGRDNLLCSIFCCMCGERFPTEDMKKTLTTFLELTERELAALLPKPEPRPVSKAKEKPEPSPILDFLIVFGVLNKYKGKDEEVVIPDSVTSIGYGAFRDCKPLMSVSISDGVTIIGEYAFSGCESLTSITIPDSVTNIGDLAFAWCESLTNITIPKRVTFIGKNAFIYCKSLTVKCSSGSYAERYCKSNNIKYTTTG